uniref:Uncharacterized protein n=1 Tax=Setaria italica TaxID=4555 RepID=K3ZPV3_SETIT
MDIRFNQDKIHLLQTVSYLLEHSPFPRLVYGITGPSSS